MARFIYLYFSGDGAGHIQSLVLGGALLIIGFMTFLIGLLADLISFNRQLVEMTLEKVRRIELEMGVLDDTEAPAPKHLLRRKTDKAGDGEPAKFRAQGKH